MECKALIISWDCLYKWRFTPPNCRSPRYPHPERAAQTSAQTYERPCRGKPLQVTSSEVLRGGQMLILYKIRSQDLSRLKLKLSFQEKRCLTGMRFLIGLTSWFKWNPNKISLITPLSTSKRERESVRKRQWDRGRGSFNAGVGQANCWRSWSLQSVMSPEWEFQLNWTLFCMIAHDNCVLIGSTGDGV